MGIVRPTRGNMGTPYVFGSGGSPGHPDSLAKIGLKKYGHGTKL